MGRKKARQCVYCGGIGPVTRDHIPPKGLFPLPKNRLNLITVPCCLPCHEGTPTDDEIFRQQIGLRADVAGHPAIESLLPSIHRSWQNPKAQGLAKATGRNLCLVRIVGGSQDGELAGGYRPDFERLHRVALRVTEGLFYHELGHRLPDSHGVLIREASAVADADRTEFLANFLPLEQVGLKEVGAGGIFAYGYLMAEEDPDTTIWSLYVYGTVPFFAATMPWHPDGEQPAHSLERFAVSPPAP